MVENWPVLSFAKNLLQETLSSEALEPLDLFDRVQLANVVEVVSISRALLKAVSSTSRPQGGKQRSSNDAGLPASDQTARASSRESFGSLCHGKAHDASEYFGSPSLAANRISGIPFGDWSTRGADLADVTRLERRRVRHLFVRVSVDGNDIVFQIISSRSGKLP